MSKHAFLKNIDLSEIIAKFYEEQPCSLKTAEKVAQEYLKFIFLTTKHKFQLVPSKEIDLFWHCHILNTPLYRKFCDTHFGKYLDHIPQLKKEAKQMGKEEFLKTQAAFKKEYGHYMR